MFLKKKKPSLNEIDAVFRNELAPHFKEVESLRGAVFSRIGIAILIDAILTALFFSFALSNHGNARNLGELIPMLGGACIAIGFFLARGPYKTFRSEFKEKIMNKIAQRFFPEMKYFHALWIEKNLYDESKLFRESLDTYTGGDYFKGKIGDVDFQFSELLCQYTTGSGKNRTTHTAFRGFFFVGDFHRDFYFRTTIEPDLAERMLGVLGRGLQRIGSSIGEEKLVDLENPEFEKLFVTKSSDQVEARYILTPTFMEKLVFFRNKVGNPLHLCFVNGKMFLAINTNHDYFEPKLFGNVIDRKDLMKFLEMLYLLFGVAEEFLHHPKFSANPPKMKLPPLPILKRKG
jgi:hypothetical protein